MTAARLSFTEGLAYWEENFPQFAEACLNIRTKDGQVAALELNKAQQYIHQKIESQRQETGKVRALIVKGRQQGASTYVEGRFYWRTIFRMGVRTFILAHDRKSSATIYEMAQRYHDSCPIAPSTGTSNARELLFDKLDSGYGIGTAGNDSVGRGTTLQYFHGSEVAFWPQRVASSLKTGIFQAVSDNPETEIILESTGNGITGDGAFFYQEVQKAIRGESEYQLIFVPWYWSPEYSRPASGTMQPNEYEQELMDRYGLTREQISWRRVKIQELTTPLVDGVKAFKQEYPMTVHEAFQYSGEDGFIRPGLVRAARDHLCQPATTLIVGVDPSRGGDRFAVIRRAGRKMYGPETYTGEIDFGKQVQICKAVLDNEKPAMMFVDAGGGDALVDRLWELGYNNVRAIPFGGKALNPEKYKNRRAEMWGELAEWLDSDVSGLEVDLPDDDNLQADLCTPQLSRDSADRFVLESKDSMRKRGMPSPDLGDAAALTFAEPVRGNVQTRFTMKTSLGG
jgi:hypothetical protein